MKKLNSQKKCKILPVSDLEAERTPSQWRTCKAQLRQQPTRGPGEHLGGDDNDDDVDDDNGDDDEEEEYDSLRWTSLCFAFRPQ